MKQKEKQYIEPLSIKVTKIGKKYHARLFCMDKLHNESTCDKKSDISFICRDLLRWYDKLSYEPYSLWAEWSRHNNDAGYRQHYLARGKTNQCI